MTQSSSTISMTTVIKRRRHVWHWRGNSQHTQHELVPCLSNQLNGIFMRCTCHVPAIYLQPQTMLVSSELEELSSEYFCYRPSTKNLSKILKTNIPINLSQLLITTAPNKPISENVTNSNLTKSSNDFKTTFTHHMNNCSCCLHVNI